MDEAFVQWLWKHSAYTPGPLLTTSGEVVIVYQRGLHNTHLSGPDFQDARIKIGDTLWMGHVEIHVHGKQWFEHKHDIDKAYNNTILHVVVDGASEGPAHIPAIELAGRIPPEAITFYNSIADSTQSALHCSRYLDHINPMSVMVWMERMTIERIEAKTKRIQLDLSNNGNNWKQTAYATLLRAFLSPANSKSAEVLAICAPLSTLLKLDHSKPIEIEAFLLGQAGMLDVGTQEDDHIRTLKENYNYLKHKHNLSPMDASSWKYGGVRPRNFPSFKLAQFAKLMSTHPEMWRALVSITTKEDVATFFDVEVGPYWQKHYVLGKEVKENDPSLSTNNIAHLACNAVVPLLFAYSKYTGNLRYAAVALELWDSYPREENHILRAMKHPSLPNKRASHSQGLMHLHNEYCVPKNCLSCAIGTHLMKPSKILSP